MRRYLLGCLGILALLLAACAPAATPTPIPGVRPTATAAPAEPIKVGFLGPLTGPFGALIKSILNGMEWRIEQEGGQVAGRPIKIIPADSGYDVATGLSKAQRLIGVDKVSIIVGPALSVQAVGMREFMVSSGIPWIVPETATTAFQPPANVVTIYVNNEQTAVPEVAQYFAKEKGIKKAIVIGFDYIAGAAVRTAVKRMFAAAGIEVIQELTFPQNVPDFGPIIGKMKLDEPNLVISGAVWGADANRFIQQAEDFGVKKKALIAIPNGLINDDGGLAKLGKAAEGVMTWYDLPPPNYPSPEYDRFVDAYKLKFGVAPVYGYRGYVAGSVLVQAIKAMGGRVGDTAAFAKAMRQPVDTPTGTYTFDDCGQPVLTQILKEAKLVGGVYEWSYIKAFPGIKSPCPAPPPG